MLVISYSVDSCEVFWMARTHRDLAAWQLAMDLVQEVYELTASFPEHERFGLTNQLRRSAVSVPSNIAEGAARQTKKEFIQFLYVSRGSLSELQTQLEIADKLAYCPDQGQALQLTSRVFSVLGGLINKLKR